MSELLSEARFAVPVDRTAVAKDWAARGFSWAT